MMPLETRRVTLLSAAAYAGMFVVGIVMALLGAILPALADHLQFSTADIGTLFLVMNGAMLASVSVLGLAIDRFGMKPPMALGPLFVAAALVIVARAGAFANLLPAVILLGIGGGAVNSATNTLVADLHEDPRRKSAALNVLGVFFGFGALFLPFLIGTLLAWFSVGSLVLGVAALCSLAGIYAAVLPFPAPKQGHALPIADMPRFLRSPLVLSLAYLLFFESGVEFTLGGFISVFVKQEFALSLAAIAWILAGYWASIMIARALLGRIALHGSPHRIVTWCALGACAGAILAALAPSAGVAAFAVTLTGLSLAGVFPTVLGIAGARFESHSGTVFGILFTVGLSGGMTLPWLAGHIGAALGLRWVMAMVAVAFAVIFTLSRVAADLDMR